MRFAFRRYPSHRFLIPAGIVLRRNSAREEEREHTESRNATFAAESGESVREVMVLQSHVPSSHSLALAGGLEHGWTGCYPRVPLSGHVTRHFATFNKLTTHSPDTVGELKRPEACEHLRSVPGFGFYRIS